MIVSTSESMENSALNQQEGPPPALASTVSDVCVWIIPVLVSSAVLVGPGKRKAATQT